MAKNKKVKKKVTTVKTVGSLAVESTTQNSKVGKSLTNNQIDANVNGILVSSSNSNLVNEETSHPASRGDHDITNSQLDYSVIREPINLGTKNVKQILECIQTGTPEIKDVILNECNIIYECKVCQSLFRSLANFIAHKRVYCTNHCCEKMLLFDPTIIDINHGSPVNDEEEIEEDSKTFVEQELEAQEKDSDTLQNSPTQQTSYQEDKVVSQKRKHLEECAAKIEREKLKTSKTSVAVFQLSPIKSNPNAYRQRLLTGNSDSEVEDNNLLNLCHTSPEVSKCVDETEQIDTCEDEEKDNQSRCSDTIQSDTSSLPNGNVDDNGNDKADFEKKWICTTSCNGREVESVERLKMNKNSAQTLNNDIFVPEIESMDLCDNESSKTDDDSEESCSLTNGETVFSENSCKYNHHVKRIDISHSSNIGSQPKLKVHMQKVSEQERLVYPCPLCSLTFNHLSHAARHVINMHNKSKTQLHNLREVMKLRAYPVSFSSFAIKNMPT